VLVALVALIATGERNAKELFSLAFAAIAVLMAVGGLLGALMEILFARHHAVRIFFLCLGLTLIVGFWTENAMHLPEFGIIGRIGAAIMLVGGLVMFVIRARESRRLISLLSSAAGDVEKGRVLVFHRPAAISRGIEEEKEDSGPTVVELLPESSVVYRIDNEQLKKWRVLPQTSVAAMRSAPYEAPWPENHQAYPPDVALTQRHMSDEEVKELQRHQKRLLQRMVWQTLIIMWATAVLVSSLQKLLKGSLAANLRGFSFASAFAVGAAYFIFQAEKARRLLGDIVAKRVVIVRAMRSKAGDVRASVSEVLPVSGLVWRVESNPAPWRIRRW
jgi:hypothetical protein